MYGTSRHFAEQYRKTGVSAKVTEADPHRSGASGWLGGAARAGILGADWA